MTDEKAVKADPEKAAEAAPSEPEKPAPAEEVAPPCVNCGADSVVTTDGVTANALSFCAACRPENV